MRSAVAKTKPAVSLAPDQYLVAANGAAVDLSSYDANVIEIVTGTFGGTTPGATAKIQSSADQSTWVDIPDADLDGVTGNASTNGFTLAASSVRVIGYTSTRRYVRVILATITGTAPVIRAAASVVRTAPKTAP